jgi:hypothetical protein
MQFLQNRGCVGLPSWLPDHVRRADMADEWARSPPAVSGVPCCSGDENAEIFSTPRTILGMGLKWLPSRVTLVFLAV